MLGLSYENDEKCAYVRCMLLHIAGLDVFLSLVI